MADGLAERDREEIHQGRLRRYYRLTDTGVRALAIEVNRMAANVRAASGALRARGLNPALAVLPALSRGALALGGLAFGRLAHRGLSRGGRALGGGLV